MPGGCEPCDTCASWSGIAEQHQIIRRARACDRIGECELPGFVDHEDVEGALCLGPAEEPRRSGNEAVALVKRLLVGRDADDARRVAELGDVWIVVVFVILVRARKHQATRVRRALDGVHQIVCGLVAARRDPNALSRS